MSDRHVTSLKRKAEGFWGKQNTAVIWAWPGKSTEMATWSAPAASPNPGLGEDDLKYLHEALYPVRKKYRSLGLQLGLPIREIRAIEQTDPGECLLEILLLRVNKTEPLTWNDVDTALRSEPVGESRIADGIRKQLFSHDQVFEAQDVGRKGLEMKQVSTKGKCTSRYTQMSSQRERDSDEEVSETEKYSKRTEERDSTSSVNEAMIKTIAKKPMSATQKQEKERIKRKRKAVEKSVEDKSKMPSDTHEATGGARRKRDRYRGQTTKEGEQKESEFEDSTTSSEEDSIDETREHYEYVNAPQKPKRQKVVQTEFECEPYSASSSDEEPKRKPIATIQVKQQKSKHLESPTGRREWGMGEKGTTVCHTNKKKERIIKR